MNCSLLAYLDPGSGSALMGAVFALCGAFMYSAKSLFFRYVLGKKIDTVKPHEGIAIFSEGKNYWGTFRPIVEELLRRGIDFSYYTMDVKDPALHIDSPHMFSRLYDKDKITSFRKLSSIKAKVLLATTPNIGTPGYPLAKPKNLERMVHVFHDPIGDIAYYAKGSLDHYDDVFLVGVHNEQPIRELEKKRNLTPKVMHVCGVPYLDDYVKKVEFAPKADSEIGKTTVLIASSWGEKGLLKKYGYQFIKDLLDAGYRVIVRPHPHSYQAEREFISEVEKKALSWGASWDRNVSGFESMNAADIMISDTSGVRFDFAYVFGKPVVTMKIEKTAVAGYEAEDLDVVWTDSVASQIGIEVDSTDKIPEAIGELSATKRDLVAWRDAHCANFGCAAKAIVDEMVKMEAV